MTYIISYSHFQKGLLWNYIAVPLPDTGPPGKLFSVTDEHGGKLPNRVVLFCDELGTMPAFDILPLFSADRSRKLTLVPTIQSQTAEVLSKALGNRAVLSGSINKGKNDPSQSLQMIERP